MQASIQIWLKLLVMSVQKGQETLWKKKEYMLIAYFFSLFAKVFLKASHCLSNSG